MFAQVVFKFSAYCAFENCSTTNFTPPSVSYMRALGKDGGWKTLAPGHLSQYINLLGCNWLQIAVVSRHVVML